MKMNNEQAKIVQAEIGVYDSGVGGISFLPSVQRLLPAERLVYFGDLANAPYGERSQDFILQRARVVTAFFKERALRRWVLPVIRLPARRRQLCERKILICRFWVWSRRCIWL